MPKYSFQDVIKIKTVQPSRPPVHYPEAGKEDGGSRYALWFVAVVSIVFLLFALSFLFSGANVTVNPKVKDIALNANLSAVKDSTSGSLSFDLVAIAGEETKIVSSLEAKDVSIKATGKVVIYNAFSSAPQKLLIDTRLEGSNGKLYKTDSKVTVPGMSSNGTPGSVEVGIYANIAGVEGNSAPLDFKIFGFKGTPKYSKFYARSKGDITGGLIGKYYKLSEADKSNAENELKAALQDKLMKKAADQIPAGFILFKDAAFLDVSPSTIEAVSKEANVPVTIKGTFYGFLFDEKKLTKKIIETASEKYDENEVYISNIRDLKFTIFNRESISFGDVKNITFSLSGAPKIVWRVDTEKLTADMLGKRKKDFAQILSFYPNIDSADLVIRPLWKSSFPEKAKDIKIIVNYPHE